MLRAQLNPGDGALAGQALAALAQSSESDIQAAVRLLTELQRAWLQQLVALAMAGAGSQSAPAKSAGAPLRAGSNESGGSGSPAGRASLGSPTHGDTSLPSELNPNAAHAAEVARELGFRGEIGGVAHRDGPSDHPHGNAIDLMTHNDTATGRRLAEYYRQHPELGVKYVIYQQQIASASTGWQWKQMRDRGSATANHEDHVHVSLHA